ncbi:MAG TPA: bifunctional phosphoglucose/phosphomannose isomerase, partial [Bacteroidota bacterium]|nr:bifunctional phosphoglucose/phosphomannose isomerase [Bacteroidota bacterium]
AKIPVRSAGVSSILLTGLGGSAIGGDLLRAYLSDELAVPFSVNRHYALPEFVGPKTLVIVSSYSGNTEETIAAQKDATRRKARVLCISTGGAVTEFARKRNQPCISIPGGLQPRAALAYSFFPLLIALGKAGFIRPKDKDVRETIELLRQKSRLWSTPDASANPAINLAGSIKGKLPVIYSGVEHLDAVNLRWRGQIEENAKQLAYGNVFPEMNHNELVGWNGLADLMKQMHVVILRDKADHARVAVRENITKEIINRHSSAVTEVWSDGTSLLARMFSLVHFGDWVSFYLAILNGQDPTPVRAIDHLKDALARVQ